MSGILSVPVFFPKLVVFYLALTLYQAEIRVCHPTRTATCSKLKIFSVLFVLDGLVSVLVVGLACHPFTEQRHF